MQIKSFAKWTEFLISKQFTWDVVFLTINYPKAYVFYGCFVTDLTYIDFWNGYKIIYEGMNS